MQISILGCGWLGLPLAKHFVNQGFQVKGTTTRTEKISLLEDAGIYAYQILLSNQNPALYDDFCKGSDVIVIAIPPGRGDQRQLYPTHLKAFAQHISRNQKVVFVSSTSVYPNCNAEVDEDMELKAEGRGAIILEAENELRKLLQNRLSIVRFSGLVGYDRKPGRFLAGKKDLPHPDAPVNLIHRDDCIQLIEKLIRRDCWGEIINGSADQHPTRKEFYTVAAINAGLIPPEFTESEEEEWKTISNKKGKQLLQMQYRFPDPFMMLKV